jgi:glycerol kinase
MDAMSGDGARLSSFRVDGGMAANAWLCQFLADIMDMPVERPENLETTALGAAFLAGLATGVWPDLEALSATWKQRDCFMPSMPADRRAQLVEGWRTAVRKTLSN